MSLLKVFEISNPVAKLVITSPAEISALLGKVGVRFDVWPAAALLGESPAQEDIIRAYNDPIEKLKKEYGFESADSVTLEPDHPECGALRRKFMEEHTHSDLEARFFVAGSGLFYIHIDGYVYGVMCNAGDLISVPAHTKHWFDMGEKPRFTCIRLFTSPEGWVAHYTGSAVALTFPAFEEFCV